MSLNLLMLLAGGLLDPHGGTVFWVLITFLLLLFILYKMAWKPILDGLEGREKQIEAALKKAEDSNKEAAEIMAKFDGIIADANHKADAIVKNSRETAEKLRVELTEKAQVEAEKMIETAKKEIEQDRATMMQEMKSEIVSIIMQVSEKVVDSSLNTEKNKELVHREIEAFSKN